MIVGFLAGQFKAYTNASCFKYTTMIRVHKLTLDS